MNRNQSITYKVSYVTTLNEKVWMVLAWQITHDLPNSPNFPPAKLSHFKVNVDIVQCSEKNKRICTFNITWLKISK